MLRLLLLLFFAGSLQAQCPKGEVPDYRNLVRNGDFSQKNRYFHSDYRFHHPDRYPPGTMMPEQHYSVVRSPRDIHPHFVRCRDHSPNDDYMMVVNGSMRAGRIVWQQEIDIVPETEYYFSCWVASAIPVSPARLRFSINGEVLQTPIRASTITGQWQQFYSPWYSGEHDKVTISIINTNTAAGGNDFMLDDIAFYFCLPMAQLPFSESREKAN